MLLLHHGAVHVRERERNVKRRCLKTTRKIDISRVKTQANKSPQRKDELFSFPHDDESSKFH